MPMMVTTKFGCLGVMAAVFMCAAHPTQVSGHLWMGFGQVLARQAWGRKEMVI